MVIPDSDSEVLQRPTLTIMETEPTVLFDNYDQDLRNILQSVQGKLDEAAKGQRGGKYYFILRCPV